MLFLPGEQQERYEETYMLAMLAGFGYYCGGREAIEGFARRGWVETSEYSTDAALITDAGLAELGKRGRAW